MTNMPMLRRHCLRYLYFNRSSISRPIYIGPSYMCLFHSKTLHNFSHISYLHYWSVNSCYLNLASNILKSIHLLAQTNTAKMPLCSFSYKYELVAYYSSNPFNSPPRSLRRRKSKSGAEPSLDKSQFQAALSKLLPRFTPEELCNVITLEDDPLVCLELFNWASQQPRFKHDVCTYHITIKKLGAAKMYQEMDDVVNQVLAVPYIGSEALYNTMIYYFTEARKFTRAVNIYKIMRENKKLDCRPSIRTYNLLFAALLSRGSNSYINHMYMESIRGLFKQMVNDGVEPDIFALNSMIKGYVLSLHVNDALRIYHQMGVIYNCLPNAYSYDYLIHGLCAQGRTNNAKELCDQMKKKGFVPNGKTYNSLVNSLALAGEVDEAVTFLREMTESRKSADFITYRTVLDEICRQRRVEEALRLLNELHEKDLVDGHAYRKLRYEIEDNHGNSKESEDNYGNSTARDRFR